ncbi:DUF4139 domain-containing protein [Halomonas heilongjiangensis]|nr:DUF4139 domain-containing protein [Halomonas heilongjiangensis]PXX90527.1 hypothetical protein CR158_09350 [Halomonas heilongjiangensis]
MGQCQRARASSWWGVRPGAVALLLWVGGGLAGPLAAEQRVATVTLSSGGLAEIHRTAPLEGSGILHLDVPLEQVDDILKSLVVRDPEGRLVSLTLDGHAAVEETFRRLPFGPEDMGSVVRLAGALQGVPVRATSGGRSVEGLLLGVDVRPPRGEGQEETRTLAVLDDEGIVATLRLASGARLEILDASLRERLRQAARISGRGRTDEMRRIAIALEGQGEREVGLSYVVAAPVWKTAYRLLLDGEREARLQAWAVIENASGADWDAVTLTLSSGAPVTLSQRLLQRYWHTRPEVPVSADTAAPPRPDRGAVQAPAKESALARGMAASDMAAVAEPAQPALATQGATAATWRLPQPVDLAAGRTLSVPYIDARVPAERLSVFQPERGEDHPVAAVRLENDTENFLPTGLVTVYEEGVGHVGDINLPGIPAGDARLASFAADRQVRISSESRPEESLARVTIVDGTLRATRLSRVTTRYALDSEARAPRRVMIEHPARAGWRFSSDALVESTPTHRRLRVELDPGGSVVVEAREEVTRSQNVALVDADTELLAQWTDAADDDTAEALAALLEHRRGVAEVEDALRGLERDLQRAADSQARIRDNLAAVGIDSEPGQRYVAELEAQDARIASLAQRREQAEERLAMRRAELAALLREL